MNYELAKQLKDAGFPQRYGQTFPNADFAYKIGEEELHLIHEDNDTNWRIGNDYSHSEMSDEEMEKNWIKVPTLSELIEACGNGFHGLFKDYLYDSPQTFKWAAGLIEGEDFRAYLDKTRPFGIGSTPEEAVAHLWLMLNKK